MDDHPHPRASRVLTVTTTLGLGALAGLAAYAVLAPPGAPGRDPLRRPFLPPPPAGRADDAPDHAARGARRGDKALVGRSVTIGRPRDEVWAFLSDTANLARFMQNVEAIEDRGDGSHAWTLRGGPLGGPVTVVTRAEEVREGEQVGWRSTGDSEVATEGRITLRDAGARGTVVEAVIAWAPPGGEIGRLVAKLFSAEPGIQARRDLRRLRMLLEAGEIATSHFHKGQEQ